MWVGCDTIDAMAHETHTEVRRWGIDDFPFDHTDPHVMSSLHQILPDGYWVAVDKSADDDVALVLLENEGY